MMDAMMASEKTPQKALKIAGHLDSELGINKASKSAHHLELELGINEGACMCLRRWLWGGELGIVKDSISAVMKVPRVAS